jgi:hypothetical protein
VQSLCEHSGLFKDSFIDDELKLAGNQNIPRERSNTFFQKKMPANKKKATFALLKRAVS